MKRLLLATALSFQAASAWAQSYPNWALHYIPTPTEWNTWWGKKQDFDAPITIDGSKTWSPGQTAITNGEIHSFTNQSGLTASGPAATHYFGIASDTVQSTGVAFANVQADLTTGAGIKGGRNDIWANLSINGTPGDAGQYVAGTFAAQATAPANAGGNIIYGINPTSGLSAGATGNWSVVGGEVDVRAVAGTTPPAVTGFSIVPVIGHAVRGSLGLDSGLVFGNQAANPGWKYGIRFCGPSVPCPFGTDSTLIYGYPGTTTTFANGLDWSSYTFNNALLVSPNSWVNKNGSGDTLYKVSGLASAGTNVNFLTLVANGTGGNAQLRAQGTDATIGVQVSTQGATSSVFLQSNAAQNTMFQAAGVSGSDSWVTALPGIAASQIIQLFANGSGNNILLGGPLGGSALSTSATTGFPQMPASNGTPTGVPVNSGSGGSFELNITSKTLNIYVPGVGWYHATLTSGAA